jgi:hypothetical protein
VQGQRSDYVGPKYLVHYYELNFSNVYLNFYTLLIRLTYTLLEKLGNMYEGFFFIKKRYTSLRTKVSQNISNLHKHLYVRTAHRVVYNSENT